MRALAAVLLVVLLVGLAATIGGFGPRADEAEAGQWTFAESMSQRRSYVAAATIDGQIYAAGGMVGETGRPLDLLARYEPQTDSWTTLTRMPEAVRAGAAASVDGVLYVIGGSTGTATARPSSPTTRRPTRGRRRPRFPRGASTTRRSRWAGRSTSWAGSPRARSFATSSSTTRRPTRGREGPALPIANHAFDAVAFRDEIWMLGGRRGDEVLSDVWILDPQTGEWRRGPAMPKPMELLGAAVVGDQIHAIWEDTYQIYDASTGTWTTGPSSLVARHGLQTFYVDGTLYTVGGCTTQLRDSQVVERRVLPAR